jgi:hypothetical protein
MYIRVLRASVDAAKADEAAEFAPAIAAGIKKLPGCGDVHIGIDRTSGQMIAVSTWDTLENAQWDTALMGDAVAPLVPLGFQAGSPEIFEQAG